MDLRLLSKLLEPVHVGKGDVQTEGPKSDGAVHRSGVDVDITETVGHALGESALARPRGTVDRDNNSFMTHEVKPAGLAILERERRLPVILKNLAILHHKFDVLQFLDACPRIGTDGDHIRKRAGLYDAGLSFQV